MRGPGYWLLTYSTCRVKPSGAAISFVSVKWYSRTERPVYGKGSSGIGKPATEQTSVVMAAARYAKECIIGWWGIKRIFRSPFIPSLSQKRKPCKQPPPHG